jgi:ferredoxin-type protein NapH
MKHLYSINTLSRIVFLLITPIFFQFFACGFIWHSIYWGVISMVVIIWTTFAFLSPIFGRIGCGWFCFMGAANDLSSNHSIVKTKWKKPKIWVRLLILVPFFTTSIAFYFYNQSRGVTHNFEIAPSYIPLSFNDHYKIVWAVDIGIAILFGIILDKRWMCKNLCMMGAICATGASYSRLLPVVDTQACTMCGKCEKTCLIGIPMLHDIPQNQGLITNSECILCGKCVSVCPTNAIRLKFVWNRKKYIRRKSLQLI